MSIGRDDVLHVARLAELAVREGELDRLVDQLNRIVDYVAQLDQVPVDRPLAVIMGSERDGLTKAAKSIADVRFWVPMSGFTDSFNVSVSCALALFDLTRRRRQFLGTSGDLPYAESEARALDSRPSCALTL